MASIPLDFSDEKPGFNTVKSLVSVIHQHMHVILENTDSREALKTKCTSRLEYSEGPVLSNLYWGIENTEAAFRAQSAEEKAVGLETSETMLQIPAALEENGVTMGISNGYLICCAYIYLSVVEFLRGNEWQTATHFLKAVLVEPRIVYEEFAPGMWQRLLPLFIRGEVEMKSIGIGHNYSCDFDDGMRWMARRYRPWLVYYQIVSTADFPSRGHGISLPDDHSQNLEEMYQEYNTSVPMLQSHIEIEGYSEKITRRRSSTIKSLRDVLTESEPDSPVSQHSYYSYPEEDVLFQAHAESTNGSLRVGIIHSDCDEDKALNQYGSLSCVQDRKRNEERKISLRLQTQAKKIPNKSASSDNESQLQFHHFISSISLRNYQPQLQHNSFSKMVKNLSCRPIFQTEENTFAEKQCSLLDKLILNLCFAEKLGIPNQDYKIEMGMVSEVGNSKPGLTYSLLKDIILDQLLIAISSSKQDTVVRTSISILSTIVSENRSVIQDLKRKGLQLHDLATALKRNVHEAVILLYLINPSPVEIKTLELLPFLVEVVCTSKSFLKNGLMITPPSASLMIIEVLVTAFAYNTNGAHLRLIISPRVLSGLMKVPREDHVNEIISSAAVLVECMRFDGKCRKHVCELLPIAPYVSLLCSNERRSTSVGLYFFHELIRIPRSSSTRLLERIQRQGSVNNMMCALFLLTQNSEPEYRLLAANLLLQLEVLENKREECVYREGVLESLLDSVMDEDFPSTQALSASILSNLGGTYSWTGEPYTMPWLVKKTVLTLAQPRNLIKNYDFFDQSLMDSGIDPWCSKIAQRVLHGGNRIFHALNEGLKSKLKRVSRDCLIAASWLGCELLRGPDEVRHAACEIVLQSIQQYIHPGLELEERLLACLCIYNYTSGKGMKELISLSDRVRESLRRLSNVTWMAEELLKVADYFHPNMWRISCVHSQILEAGNKNSGSVTALIYYKGQLCSGYANGSIKVWDITGQSVTLVEELKEHKKAVTCFALYEPGNCLLSGSSDKTMKMWQMLETGLECIEVIPTKESIKSIDSRGELIFATTQSHKLKVLDASRKATDVFRNKRVKCVRVSNAKLYAGCMDSSIQELTITSNREREIKGPSKSWMHNKPISSIAVFKDYLYCASYVVEGSKMKGWRRRDEPQILIEPEKGSSILAMEVVEDFIYLNCSSSMSSLQILLRGTQQKVGRLSAGSKITSILSGNDMVLCGTEKGLIKGWIPI